MGLERIALFGIIDLDLESTAAATLTMKTDMPGNAMDLRETKPIAATGRRVVRFRLKGSTKGHLYSIKIVPGSGVTRLYGGRIWARVLPSPQWEWLVIPIPPTPEEWTPVPLPIPPTPQEWSPVPLPIPPTPQEWSPVPLPIPPTPQEWSPVKLPIRPTPENFEWIKIPIDE